MQAYQQLEEDFATWLNLENPVACSSGIAALHLALEALTLPTGNKVIVPELTMVACARAVVLAGLTPVFVDCNERLLVDTEAVRRVLDTEHDVSAIMPVHLYGRRCDMNEIAKIATEHKLAVVEDLAEAHGVLPHPGTAAACWSMYRNKIVHGEEGGLVAFREVIHADKARSLRNMGFTEFHDFMHIPRGHNYRLSNCHAELILKSLYHADENIKERRRIEELYEDHCPAEWRMPPREAPWVYDLRISDIGDRLDTVVRTLVDNGIQARHCFKPMSWQPEFRSDEVNPKKLPWRSAAAASQLFYLPIVPFKTPADQIARSFEIIREVLNR